MKPRVSHPLLPPLPSRERRYLRPSYRGVQRGGAPLHLSPSPGTKIRPGRGLCVRNSLESPFHKRGTCHLRCRRPSEGGAPSRHHSLPGVRGWAGRIVMRPYTVTRGVCRGAKPLCISFHPPLPKGDSGGLALGDEVEVGTARASAAFCGHDGTWPYVGRSGFLLSQE